MFLNFRKHFSLLSPCNPSVYSSKIGAVLFLALTSSAAPIHGLCPPDDTLKLSGLETIITSANDVGLSWLEVELPADRFIIVEAQPIDLGGRRPSVTIFDETCRPKTLPKGLSHLKGRAVFHSDRQQKAFIEVRTENPSGTFILDLWADLGASPRASWTKDRDDDPVPEAPIDEWEEIVTSSEGCTAEQVTKNSGDTPVPPAPIDEWDELRGSGNGCNRPSEYREIQGFGLTELAGDHRHWRPICPLANRVGLLGTLTCARQVTFVDVSKVEVHRLLDDRAEMLLVRLDRPGRLDVRGVEGWILRSADGRKVEDFNAELSAGIYFLEAHAPDSVYSLTLMP